MEQKTRVAKLTGLIGFPISVNNLQGHGENDGFLVLHNEKIIYFNQVLAKSLKKLCSGNYLLIL